MSNISKEYLYFDNKTENLFENVILYKMCHDYPKHDCFKIVRGKIILIGRTYAASPERQSGITKYQDQKSEEYSLDESDKKRLEKFDILTEISKKLVNEKFDEILKNGKNEAESVIKIVNHMSELIHSVNTQKRTIGAPEKNDIQIKYSPSFCSKYLHFHFPDRFPIMDQFSIKGINKRLNSNMDLSHKKARHSDYKSFCELVYYMQNNFHKWQGWNFREIDSELIKIGKK